MSRAHYTRFQLLRFLVGDLRHDAETSAGTEYGERCRCDIGTVFKHRHTTRLDPYGWPECLKQNQPHQPRCLIPMPCAQLTPVSPVK